MQSAAFALGLLLALFGECVGALVRHRVPEYMLAADGNYEWSEAQTRPEHSTPSGVQDTVSWAIDAVSAPTSFLGAALGVLLFADTLGPLGVVFSVALVVAAFGIFTAIFIMSPERWSTVPRPLQVSIAGWAAVMVNGAGAVVAWVLA